MTIRYANNFNKGETYTDGANQVWVYAPEFNQPGVSGKRFAYIKDYAASRAAEAEYIAKNGTWYEREEREMAKAAKQAELRKMLVANLQRRLRKLGFKRVYKSKFDSRYYVNAEGYRVRISDHEVPMTEEREYYRSQGSKGSADREIIIQF